MILVVMNAILAIAWRSLKNSGLRRGLNHLSYKATVDRSWLFVGSNVHVINDRINGRNDIQLFQKMLSGRTSNVNCRTAIARLKRNVGIEY